MDLDSLAWRAVELAVQRRHDPRLIVATRSGLTKPASTARLIAGLCNAAAGRRAIALFGIDGTDVVGIDVVPDDTWLDVVTARFPGVVPTLATATIDADGALIVALAADDPGTLVVAMHSGRAVIPWFDGTLADRPPATAGFGPGPSRPPGRLEVRSGWLERTDACSVRTLAPANDAAVAGDTHAAGAATDIGVWRGSLDIALERRALIGTDDGGGAADAANARARLDLAADAALAGLGDDRTGRDTARTALRPAGVAIADRDLTVTLLADGSAGALSLDVQIHPIPGASAAVRSAGGLVIDPLVPCRLYVAAAVTSPGFDGCDDLGGAVRLLVSLRFPGDDRLVAAMATLQRTPSAATQRWTL